MLKKWFEKYNRKPRVLILADRPGWAFDICARALKNILSEKVDISIAHVINQPDLNLFDFDLLHVCFWGEKYHQSFVQDRSRIIKEISSHRWENEEMYGKLTPFEFAERYLCDAGTLVATSSRLVSKIQGVRDVFLAPLGVDPNVFFNKNERKNNELQFGWAGNKNDMCKGLNDILKPASQGLCALNIAPGSLKHEEMNGFYNCLDVICVASTAEGTPMPLLEAMAAGCFPICTDVGVVREIIEHGKNGLIVPRTITAFKDAIRWCLNNVERVRQEGEKNSFVVLNERSWEKVSNRWLHVWEKALAKVYSEAEKTVAVEKLKGEFFMDWGKFFESWHNKIPTCFYPDFNMSMPYHRYHLQNNANAIFIELRAVSENNCSISIVFNKLDQRTENCISCVYERLKRAGFNLAKGDVGIEIFKEVPRAMLKDICILVANASADILSEMYLNSSPVARGIKKYSFYDDKFVAKEKKLLSKLACMADALPKGEAVKDNKAKQKLHKEWWGLRSLRLASKLSTAFNFEDFNAIYHGGGWDIPGEANETVSGSGSLLKNTKVVRNVLNSVIPAFNIKSVLDVPCGDFNWMRYVNFSNVKYLGGDVVPDLIQTNICKYASEQDIEFSLIDLRSDFLPSCDLVVVKDLFIHLRSDEIFAALSNIKLSNSKFLLASTCHYIQNKEERKSSFRLVNLLEEPYCLPDPQMTFFEDVPNAPTRCIALWKISELPFFYSRCV